MRAIWKYPMPLSDGARHGFDMPVAARVLHVHEQGGIPTLWALVDDLDGTPIERRKFRIVGTGHGDVEATDVYVGSAHCGAFVWHVFEVYG